VSLFSMLLLAALVQPLPTYAAMELPGIETNLTLPGIEQFVSGIITHTSAEASSGGVTTKGESVTEDAEASASVHTVIRGGENSTVRIDVRTRVDGTEHATTVERVVPEGRAFEIHIATTSSDERSSARISARFGGSDSTSSDSLATTTSWVSSLFARLESAVSSMFSTLFSRWQ